MTTDVTSGQYRARLEALLERTEALLLKTAEFNRKVRELRREAERRGISAEGMRNLLPSQLVGGMVCGLMAAPCLVPAGTRYDARDALRRQLREVETTVLSHAAFMCDVLLGRDIAMTVALLEKHERGVGELEKEYEARQAVDYRALLERNCRPVRR